jgi:hypothetical protein
MAAVLLQGRQVLTATAPLQKMTYTTALATGLVEGERMED